MNKSRNQSKKASAPETRTQFPEAFQYTALQFNALPGWARDTILALEEKVAALERLTKWSRTRGGRTMSSLKHNSKQQPAAELSSSGDQPDKAAQARKDTIAAYLNAGNAESLANLAEAYAHDFEQAAAELERVKQINSEMLASLKPFALAAQELTYFKSIATNEQFIWKPTNNKRATYGITAQDLLDARATRTHVIQVNRAEGRAS